MDKGAQRVWRRPLELSVGHFQTVLPTGEYLVPFVKSIANTCAGNLRMLNHGSGEYITLSG